MALSSLLEVIWACWSILNKMLSEWIFRRLPVPDPYYLDKKVKMVELFSYHKLGLMNKYTHLFGDS
jgi:hypothetical protein